MGDGTLTAEKLAWLHNGYEQKKDFFVKDRNRWIETAKIYWGVDYGQYPAPVVQQLLDEGRQAPTFNIMANKMDGLRGSLLRNQFDMKYVPMESDVDEWALRLQDMYYSDKDDMNWDWSYDVFLRDFLIQYGAEWMYIDTSISPFGNIAFKPDIPYNLFPDPGWKTPFHKDLKELDKVGFYSANELKKLYPSKAREIEESYKIQKYFEEYGRKKYEYDHEYGVHETGPAYQNIDYRWGQKQPVVERHQITDEVLDWEYNLRDGELFPETGYKLQSPEDIQRKKDYILQRNLTADDIRFIPRNRSRYHILTGCRVFDVVLEDKDSPIQIGWIPCFITGPAKFGTQFRGIGDLAKDIQLNLNRYLVMMMEILNRSGRGAFFLNEAIVKGDHNKMRNIEKDWNNPSARIWIDPLDPNAVDKYVKELPTSHVPSDLMAFHNLMNDYGDKLLYQTPASEGRVESAKESGKLYQSKFEAHMIARGALDRMLEMHQHSKAEAYMEQAKITYSGVPRIFSTKDGKSKFQINTTTPQGMAWDITQLGRQKVIIIPSQKGVDVRINQRGIFLELKQGTRDPLVAAVYDDRITDTLEMTDAQKEEAKKALALVKEEAATAKALNIANMRFQMQQLMSQQQMGQQIEGQQQQAQGMLPPGQENAPPITPGKKPSMQEGVKGTLLQEAKPLSKIERAITHKSQ